ncbi:MAG: SAM-dependent methyltransferase [Lachnospiraceae bacterium]|nr:SAM-dependent methyltransferase [Lachnospiraceae bacterium]
MQRLSERLLAAASLVPDGAALADIGTDHGFLPISLCETGRIRKAFAMDVAEGPLSRAKAHILEAGLQERIEVRRSDGLSELKPGEADTVSLLGMGGALIMRILTANDPRTLGIRTLLLGPQSEVKHVRAFLLQKGYVIETERLVEEDGKFYFLLLVDKDGAGEPPYSEAELLYGRNLLSGKDATLQRFLRWRLQVLEEIRRELSSSGSAAGKERLNEIGDEIRIIKEIEHGG